MALRLIGNYLEMLGKHGGAEDLDGIPFTAREKQPHGHSGQTLDPGSIYKNIVVKYGRATGINIEVNRLCVHSMRATAATNALFKRRGHRQSTGMVGHAKVSTARPFGSFSM